MRLLLALFLAIPALGPAVLAQTVTPRGDDGTFDVVAWNIEHLGDPGFAPSDNLQLNNVEAIIEQGEIDLWAIQEVGSADAWADLVGRLQDDGYGARLGPETPGSFQLRLGFIYDTSVIQVLGSQAILSGGNFGGRQPFELRARVTAGGQARTVRIIGLHAKAGTSASDYTNRTNGAALLKTYIDERIDRGESVILLGDFNDFLTRSTRRSEPTSPYAAFLADADYAAATLGIEEANVPTLCGNVGCTIGSTRDHILYTADLSASFVEGDRYSEVLQEIQGFVNTTSDHAPVLARFAFAPVAAEETPDGGIELLAAAPSPFRGATRLRFRLASPTEVSVEVFDVLGRRVAQQSGAFGAGDQTIALDGSRWAPGAYLVRVNADGAVRTQTIIRAE